MLSKGKIPVILRKTKVSGTEWLNLRCVCVLVTQSSPTLWDPMDCGPPGSSVHGILQARILEWFAISSFRGSSQPSDRTWVSCIIGRFFTIWATREVHIVTNFKISIYNGRKLSIVATFFFFVVEKYLFPPFFWQWLSSSPKNLILLDSNPEVAAVASSLPFPHLGMATWPTLVHSGLCTS